MRQKLVLLLLISFYIAVSYCSTPYFNCDKNTIALWTFDEGRGDSAFDVSTNNNHAKLMNTTWTNGFNNTAIELNGTNADGIVKLSPSLSSLTTQITLEAIVYPYSFPNQWAHVISSHCSYNMSFHFGHPAMQLSGIGGWWTPDNYDASTNKWIKIATQYNGHIQQIFINDTLINEREITGNISYENIYDIRIGGDAYYGSEGFLFHGKIDEIRISNCPRYLNRNTPTLIPYTPNPTLERRPTLKWHKVKDSCEYRIQIAYDSLFISPEISVLTLDTFFTPLADLKEGAIYWRVMSNLSYRYSSASHLYIQPDTIPYLYCFNGATLTERKPHFCWKPVKRATSYKMQLDTISTFNYPIITVETDDSSFTPYVNLPNKKYYWRVSCSLNLSAFSQIDSLIINDGVAAERIKENIGNDSLCISPNPCNPTACIRFSNPKRNAQVLIMDVNGRTISKTTNITDNYFTWSGIQNPSGLYVAKVIANGKCLSKRFLLTK